MLRMSVWLERALESFVAGSPAVGTDSLLPAAVAAELRFDARAIYRALDVRRNERGMTWAQVAAATGSGSASALTRLRDGGRIMFPGAMRMFGWLGEPAVRFTRRVRR